MPRKGSKIPTKAVMRKSKPKPKAKSGKASTKQRRVGGGY